MSKILRSYDLIDYEYFLYLQGLAGVRNAANYSFLMEELWNIEFFVLPEFPMDKNRAEDGLALRDRFQNDLGKGIPMRGKPCSVLEMLLALSERMDLEYVGSPGEIHNDVIFFHMLKNLGLENCQNLGWNWLCREKISQSCEKLNKKITTKNGRGELFPLKNWRKRGKKREIWAQMQAYISENPDF